MIDHAHVYNFRYTPKNKALQLQTVRAQSEDGAAKDVGFADAFGSWALVAPPLPPETDDDGNVKVAAEALTYQYGDETFCFATRDIRTFRYFQDLVPGEVGIGNAFGSRLKIGRTSVALNAFGGFLSWDSASKQVQLVGIPASEGQKAPYLVMSSTGVGFVSATGQASVHAEGSGVSISAATLTVDAGTVSLGKGAAEPIVTHSQIMQLVIQMNAALAAVAALSPFVPIVPPVPGKAIRVPFGG